MPFSRPVRLTLMSCMMLLSITSGCDSGPTTGDISGKVTIDGEPLPYGTIAFLAEDGASGSGTIENGRYQATEVPVGDYKVVVQSMQVPPMMSAPGETSSAPKEGGRSSLRYIPIPAKYADAKQSDLTVTIAEGVQMHDFELKGR